MTFVQGAEFKSVIAFFPEEKLIRENPELSVSSKKVFLSTGNVLLRAVIILVIVRVSQYFKQTKKCVHPTLNSPVNYGMNSLLGLRISKCWKWPCFLFVTPCF